MFLICCLVGYKIFSLYFFLQNVELLNGQTPDGNTYYEQYNAPCNVIRTGDCVYVRTDMGRQLIAQVDSVWTNKQ
jgi:protein polybromo-1